ncbi:hypothetical protein [Nostoc sp.]
MQNTSAFGKVTFHKSDRRLLIPVGDRTPANAQNKAHERSLTGHWLMG